MTITCAGCGTPSPERSRFCNRCGAPLPEGRETAANGGVLRPVAVLFADIVDSTVLANMLDAEDLGALFGAFREIVRDAAAAHGSPRIRFVGDGARLLFGHPVFAEDTPEEAIRCALHLRAAAPRALATPTGVPVPLRIGVAYGSALLRADAVESDLGSEAVIGAVAHLAARLAAAAEPGGILVDASLHDVAGAFFEFVATPPLQLKGFDAPVQAWRVLAETAVVSRHEARRAAARTGMATASIVGRARELERLRALWRDARAGAGRSVVLFGEPGVGKSRLATAMADLAAAEGALRLDLHCSPRTANAPLRPARDLLRRLAGVRREDGAARTTQLLRGWLQDRFGRALSPRSIDYALMALEPGLLPPDEGAESAELVRSRSIEALVAAVCLLSCEQPLLILLEDLQWADPTTSALLRAVLAARERWRGLIVVTTRPEARTLLDGPGVEPIALEPLAAEQAESLVRGLAAARGAELPAASVRTIVERGEGIPLYLEELTRALLDRPDDAASPAASPSARVPMTLRNVIQARVDRRPAQRRLMQAAATLGREFSLPMLASLAGTDARSVAQMVSELVEDGLLLRRGDGAAQMAAFRHALLQDAVYDTLLRSDRQQLHSRAADLLDAAAGEGAHADPALIAFHQAAAGRLRDAAASYLAAAGSTNAAAAYAEAIAFARAGLDALAGANAAEPALRRTLLIQLGVALTARDGYAGAEIERCYQQARQLCDSASDAEDLYPILRGLATFYLVKGDLKAAYELASEALARARRSHRPDHVIDALSVHGYASLYATRLEESSAMLLECLGTYRREGGQRFRYPVPQDAATAAWALLPTVQWLRGLPQAAEQAVAEGLAHVQRLDRPFDRAVLHAWIAGFRFTQRRFTAARQHAQTGLALSTQFGYSTWLAVSALMDALARAAEAPDAAAVQQAGELMERMAQSGSTLNAPYYLWGLAKGMARIGQNTQASALLAQARAQAAASGEHRIDAEIELLEIELEPTRPDVPARLQQAFDIAWAQGERLTALRIALTRARLKHADAERRAQAAAVLAQLDGGDELPQDADWTTRQLSQWAPGAADTTATSPAGR